MAGSTGPYSKAAGKYFRSGWSDAIPLGLSAAESHNGNEGRKLPGVAGFTGYDGKDVGFEQMTEWSRGKLGARNIGLRMRPNTVAIDVDHGYSKGGGDPKAGLDAIRAAESSLGALPATWTSTSRGQETPSRIHLFRLPVGKTVRKGAEKDFNRIYGEDVEIIHRTWRHVVVCPSIHPSTEEEYRWYRPGGDPAERTSTTMECPAVPELPELPEAWVAFLCDAPARPARVTPVTSADPDDLFEDASNADEPGAIREMTKATASKMMKAQLDLIREMDSHSKVRSVIGGAARLYNHFVVAGVITDDQAVGQIVGAAVENGWHSDDWNQANGKGWTAESLVRDTIAEHADDEPWHLAAAKAKEKTADDYAKDEELFSHAAIAGVVAEELLAGRFLWTSALGWLRWTGQFWEVVELGVVRDVIRKHTLSEYSRALQALADASQLAGQEGKMAAASATVRIEGWRGFQQKKDLDALVALCSDIMITDAGMFDREADLLNCPNGVVNLRTGDVMEHDPDLLMTKITAVSYLPGTTDPAFKTALHCVPEAVEKWLQVRLGQAITGEIPDDGRFVILTGDGENGKTTLMNALFDSLTPDLMLTAGYARQIVSELLLKSKGDTDAASPAKMSLMGTRLAYFEETPEGRHLDANVVKKLMDTPKMTARKLYKDNVTFSSSHAMFLNTNYVPAVAETDHGTWRRLCRVDFPYRFVSPDKAELDENERHGDPMLKARLNTEAAKEAALAWLVEGAVRFYAAGGTLKAFKDPAEVAESTRTWRLKSDQILDFFEGRLEHGAKARGSFVDRKAVYDLYVDYCQDNNYAVPNMTTFLGRLETHSAIKGVRDARVLLDSDGYSAAPAIGDWEAREKPQTDAGGRIRALTGLRFAENG